jgi:trimeric autotransporter adhesin
MKRIQSLTSALLTLLPFISLGQNWEQVGGGIPVALQSPRVLYSHGGSLIAGVQTSQPFHNPIFVWDGTQWGNPYDWCQGGNSTLDITEFQGRLAVIGGCGIAVYEASEWLNIAPVVARGFGHYQGDLIAVGWFSEIGGIPASKVARWDGIAWHAFDTTVWEGGAISCAIEYQGDLYVGGNMIDGELDIDRIGRWDGTQWHKVGNGIRGGMGTVNCLAIYEGDLYVGGRFLNGNGNPGPSIARWNGEQWLDVGGGLSGLSSMTCGVTDMVVFNGNLYAVGDCMLAGGVSAERIARWDGKEWCGFGDVFNNNISALAVHQGELYMGGAFTTINNDTVLRVAKWVGGDFVEECGTLTGVEDIEQGSQEITIYPNPTLGPLTITSTKPLLTVAVVDMLGRVLLSERGESSNSKAIDLSHLPAGIYVVQVETEAGRWAQRVVRE